jgi:hypothetical protein
MFPGNKTARPLEGLILLGPGRRFTRRIDQFEIAEGLAIVRLKTGSDGDSDGFILMRRLPSERQ